MMPASAYFLIAANLLPAVMVLNGNWDFKEILPLYWFESAIIGFFNIFRIVLARGPGVPGKTRLKLPAGFENLAVIGRIFIALFFMVHFGGFMVGHGVFLFGLVLGGFRNNSNFDILPALINVQWAVLALFISHGVSFFVNYLRGGERYRVSAAQCMEQPYSRIVVMHLTILLGAFASAMFRNVGPMMVIFIGLKLFTDLKAHLKERTQLKPV